MDTQDKTIEINQKNADGTDRSVEDTEISTPHSTEQPNKHRKRIDKLISKQSIKYRGIFSHRAVRILGFIFLFCAQIFASVAVLNKVMDVPAWANGVSNVLEIISNFALPLFLAANFCVIMTSQNNIKKTLIFYTIIALSISLLIIFIYYRYIVGVMGIMLSEDPQEAATMAESFTKAVFGKIISYNVFIDLSLFSLFYFFFFYKPKKIKSKKALLTFRSMSVLPVLLAVVSSILYGEYYLGNINLPVPILTVMPCRSIAIYAIFFILALVIKIRQVLFTRWGGTEEEYQKYANSNRSSLEISIVASIILFIVSAVDLLMLFVCPQAIIFGIGFNFYLVFSIPFIMLLSYTRKPKKSLWNIAPVLIFIFMTIILYLEVGLMIFKSFFVQ